MLSDIRFAFRQLFKSPGFTSIAILTLALGIGSATSCFSALNALLFRPLPYIQHQDRMLWINEALPSKDIDQTDICYLDFLDWQKRSRTLEAIWVYDARTVILSGTDEPERLNGTGLSPGAFQAMGAQPILGRNFRPEEDNLNAPPVAILSYGLWKRRFGGDRQVIGRIVKVNGRATTVVGVMPDGWRYPETVDIWVPLRAALGEPTRGAFSFSGHAMLKPGVTLEEARAEFATISAALAQEFPATNQGLVATLRPVREQAVQGTAQLTILLFGAVMFVFLIACTNVSNLLLARGSTRTREIAIRLALGASRGRLVRQLLIESLLLGLLGGLGGMIVGWWGTALMLAAIPIELPFWLRLDYDPLVFAFTAGLAVVSAVLFGLIPAWQASRPNVVEEIKDGGRTSTGGARGTRLRSALVIAEVALALVLLVGAGLMMRSFLNLNRVEPGFDARGVFTFRVGFPLTLTEDGELIRRFFRELTSDLAALPGVESVGATSGLPGIGAGGFTGFLVEGQPEPKNHADGDSALYRHVTPGYFDVLHIPLISGRTFNANDDEKHPAVAIIDEALAKKYFPNQDPVGRRWHRIDDAPGKLKWVNIVGVVGSTRRYLDRDEPTPTLYVPHEQDIASFMTVTMRVRGNPASYAQPARAAVQRLNKDMPIYWANPFERMIDRADTIWVRHFFGWLFAAFAALALVLASIGIYGVMAYSVAQRTQEIGVRMALGAQAHDVIAMVLRHGLGLIASGLAVGLVAAYFTAQLLAGSLYGVSPHDPPTFAAVPVLLTLVALLACYLPSLRATKVDPIIAMRAD